MCTVMESDVSYGACHRVIFCDAETEKCKPCTVCVIGFDNVWSSLAFISGAAVAVRGEWQTLTDVSFAFAR